MARVSSSAYHLLASSRNAPTPQRNRWVDVSIDTKTLPSQGVAVIHDEEGKKAPRYIPTWVLPQEGLDSLMAAGARAALDIIYARGVPADPLPDIDSFNHTLPHPL